MHYLYRITDTINHKVYIGQAVNPRRRWSDHKWNARQEKPIQYIHRAMAKYGIENFTFEVIATCRDLDSANVVEDLLIIQYDSRNKERGYNLNAGGFNGEHSEETIEKIRQATLQQIATKGHPAQGRIVSEEEKELHRKARLENPIECTEELRQKMSEAHLGIKDSEETKQRKSESAAKAWAKRISYDGIKCSAPDCDVAGKAKYKFVDGIRYCNKHGLRLLRASI